MRRADRLFQIIRLLSGGKIRTAGEIAQRLEVSERTIYRDITDLTSSGVPINGEEGVGYRLSAGYHVPPIMFDLDEIHASRASACPAVLARTWSLGAGCELRSDFRTFRADRILPARYCSVDTPARLVDP